MMRAAYMANGYSKMNDTVMVQVCVCGCVWVCGYFV